MQAILASASPRRQELLKQIGIEPLVRPSDFAEVKAGELAPAELVQANAFGKAESIAERYGDAMPVIAADTVVVLQELVLGKPADAQEAERMLRLLSGREHAVLTGVAVFYQGRRALASVLTKVFFRTLTEKEILAYIATGEPLDKAGAYGIQGRGAVFVEKIEGCYSNVVGLPLAKLYELLRQLKVSGLEHE